MSQKTPDSDSLNKFFIKREPDTRTREEREKEGQEKETLSQFGSKIATAFGVDMAPEEVGRLYGSYGNTQQFADALVHSIQQQPVPDHVARVSARFDKSKFPTK